MIDKSPFDFVSRMSTSGIGLGSLVGSVAGAMLMLLDFNYQINFTIIWTAFLGGIAGGIFGIIYGVLAGFASGFSMMCITRYCFREIHNPQRYKLVMGISTAIATTLFLLIMPLWFIFGGVGIAILLIAVLFAVYASQRVAQQYLHEMDVRKSKHRV